MAEAAAEPTANLARLCPLPDGPEVQLPWCYRQYTVDEQLANAADKLREAKTEKVLPAGYKFPVPPNVVSSAHSRGTSRARKKRMAEWIAAKHEEGMKEVKKVFVPDEDGRFLEMVRFLTDAEEEAELEVDDPLGRLSARVTTATGLGASWASEFRASLDSMLSQLKMTFDPAIGEPQLARTFQWYRTHKSGPPHRSGSPTPALASNGGPAAGLNFLTGDAVIDKPRPGSAFYVAPKDSDHYEDEAAESRAASKEPGAARRAAGGEREAQLPPARERLQGFQTKQLVSPLTARRLKAATQDECQSPELGERPFTPSTATGGSSTARSASSARSTPTPFAPYSARSSPTPLGSRPSSAASSTGRYHGRRPLTAQAQRSADPTMARPPAPPRPGTAPRLASRPPTMPASARESKAAESKAAEALSSGLAASAQQEALMREAFEREAAERETATAMQNMEERWLMRRHRDIANMTVDEERHAAVAIWAERRARVEEELAHNAEAMRFQSELGRRGTTVPADAQQDVPPTALPDAESSRPSSGSRAPTPTRSGSIRRSAQHSALLAAAAAPEPPPRGGTPPRREPARHDVSRIAGEEPQVRFAPEAVASPRHRDPDDRAKIDRIASLRRIHQHLLRASQARGDDEDSDDSDAAPESVFKTEQAAQFVSLSAYTADSTQAAVTLNNRDDADVVAAVCDHWSGRELAHGSLAGRDGEGGSGMTMHELRFKQQQEAEAAKRRLTAKNCAFNAAVVDSGLVMPAHFVKPEACVFNMEPNLKTAGLPSWFAQDPKRKKKKAKPKKSRSAAPKRKSRSAAPKAGPRR